MAHKLLYSFLTFLFLFSGYSLFPSSAVAQSASFVTIVHPVRGRNLWNVQTPQILDQHIKSTVSRNVPATFLVQYDALFDPEIVTRLKKIPETNEIGLFLEVSERLATDAEVPYKLGDGDWARPDKVFFSGYTIPARRRMVQVLISKFREVFGSIPKAAGAWYIDPQTLAYLHDSYGVSAVLTCSDQYSTDKYHLWGQYWSTPFYPSRYNTLMPAQSPENRLGVVSIQWALRDPFLAYGAFAEDSTYSLQANDYHSQSHRLNTDYFRTLSEMYFKRPENRFGQITVGLEAGSDIAFTEELDRQISAIAAYEKESRLRAVTMSDFAAWYRRTFSDLSPPHVIATDPNSDNFSFWFMSPWYRINIIKNEKELIIRDLRGYDENFIENDYVVPDTGHVLYRTITADIDQLVLKNSRTIFSDVEKLEITEASGSAVLHITHGSSVSAIIFEPKRFLIDGSVQYNYPNISLSHKPFSHTFLPIFTWSERLSEAISIFATSVIDGQRIIGIPFSAEKLLGIGFHPFHIGTFQFPVQTLTHFQRFPKIPFSRFFTSDPSYQFTQIRQASAGGIVVARQDQTLPDIRTKESSGSTRIFENSEFSIWSPR